MKKMLSFLSLTALVLLPACCCKKDTNKAKSAQTTPMCDKKKDASKKQAPKKQAPKKQDAKKQDAKKQQDSKKKYSLVNPAASKAAQRVQFEEIPQLPLV